MISHRGRQNSKKKAMEDLDDFEDLDAFDEEVGQCEAVFFWLFTVGNAKEAHSLECTRLALLSSALELLEEYAFAYEGLAVFVDAESGCVRGRMRFCDGLHDEWLVVHILREFTKKFPGDFIARVVDSDGEFLLMEGAEVLPDWVEEQQCGPGRCFLLNGDLHLVGTDLVPEQEEDVGAEDDVVSNEFVQMCIQKAIEDVSATRASPELQKEALDDPLSGFQDGSSVRESFHRATCFLSKNALRVLDTDPLLLSFALHSFGHRDVLQLEQAKKLPRFGLSSKDKGCFRQLKFPRNGFAKIVKFETEERAEDSVTKAHRLGRNVSIALELLYMNCSGLSLGIEGESQVSDEKEGEALGISVDRVRKVHAFVKRLHSNNHHAVRAIVDEALRKQQPVEEGTESDVEKDDSEDWMDFSEEQMQSFQFQAFAQAPDMLSAQGERTLNGLASTFHNFLNKESSHEGIDVSATKHPETASKSRTFDVDKLLAILQGQKRDDVETDADFQLQEAAEELMDEELSKSEELGLQKDLKPINIDLHVVQNLLESVSMESAFEVGPVSNLLSHLDNERSEN